MGISVAGEQSFAFLRDVNIKTRAHAISLLSQGEAKIEMEGGEIDFTNGIAVQIGGGGKVILEGVSIVCNVLIYNDNSSFFNLYHRPEYCKILSSQIISY
ncbi:hypothetical protein [Bartonella vinsonii]|uniref:Uncharacterized protein n=2 Tax=Bartonella vinsonii TaxID=33047 RepID=A0A448V818_BARVI|nr:hypothetical protein [Bartonella vinsonii]VEJ45859.1 Uncharacterised protein [Bartonella vinsonii]